MQYSIVAGTLATVVTAALDLLLFDTRVGDAIKRGVANGTTWLVVLLGVLWYVRLRQDNTS